MFISSSVQHFLCVLRCTSFSFSANGHDHGSAGLRHAPAPCLRVTRARHGPPIFLTCVLLLSGLLHDLHPVPVPDPLFFSLLNKILHFLLSLLYICDRNINDSAGCLFLHVIIICSACSIYLYFIYFFILTRFDYVITRCSSRVSCVCVGFFLANSSRRLFLGG